MNITATKTSFNFSEWNNATAETNGESLEALGHLLMVALSLITIIGLPANFVVVFIFRYVYASNPSSLNMVIISSSICNLLLILVAGPVHTDVYIHGRWRFGYDGCQFYGFWVHFTAVSELSHLTIISMHRYYLIASKQRARSQRVGQQLALVSAAWIYSALFAVLPFLGLSKYDFEGLHTGCAPRWGSAEIKDATYNVLLLCFEFVLPFSVILYCNIKLMKTINMHNRRMIDRSTIEEVSKRKEAQRSVQTMIIIMISAFLFSWLPYTLFCVVGMISRTNFASGKIGAIPAVFAKSSVIWNPIIYGFKHNLFRQRLRQIWRQCCQSSVRDASVASNNRSNPVPSLKRSSRSQKSAIISIKPYTPSSVM
uniref:C-like opsin n=1 Tax=Tripedalia cystophora TaxID=6141 RepID=A0A059NTD6_TRICY|nr:c-like opsin [Tripedalia cystophora]